MLQQLNINLPLTNIVHQGVTVTQYNAITSTEAWAKEMIVEEMCKFHHFWDGDYNHNYFSGTLFP